jgi:hypothetical protein
MVQTAMIDNSPQIMIVVYYFLVQVHKMRTEHSVDYIPSIVLIHSCLCAEISQAQMKKQNTRNRILGAERDEERISRPLRIIQPVLMAQRDTNTGCMTQSAGERDKDTGGYNTHIESNSLCL